MAVSVLLKEFLRKFDYEERWLDSAAAELGRETDTPRVVFKTVNKHAQARSAGEWSSCWVVLVDLDPSVAATQRDVMADHVVDGPHCH